MGRGRAKAKQTKVARELKYSSPVTDLEALQRELSGGNGGSHSDSYGGSHSDSYADQDRGEDTYADEYDEYRR